MLNHLIKMYGYTLFSQTEWYNIGPFILLILIGRICCDKVVRQLYSHYGDHSLLKAINELFGVLT